MVGIVRRPPIPPGMPRGKPRVRSRLVQVLRWLLPSLMVAVFILLLVLVASHAVRRATTPGQPNSTAIRMLNPRFFGRDSQERPYVLSASEARRDPNQPQTVLLTAPAMELQNAIGKSTQVFADTGVYHEDSRILILQGHVHGFDSGRNTNIATDRAVIDTKSGSVSSESGLAGQSSAGALQSKGFNAYDKGDRLVFKGGVHARLNGR
jgi:lipopolysaccharide export system protein LptC